ncbi:DNA mismatch repair protein MutS [Marinithermofilum abyssi]|uniref:DNA mismatch repair protein MutS n=1 Tax=Marinithermofilum abyssi TaxID=1571185 RepID=A0A8J2Y9J9_9BACL|nr:DNA mismatch repair protein MutS [Marinithermofilum abyssi]GGE24714.1 DNA mismatch repair protein MutS [Marinithermofilum abyssi]
MAKYTPMIQQYLSIKAEYPDAFLFFRLGDFYEMFFEDAQKAAEELEITLTGRDGGAERIPMCGVPHHSAEMYIARLIEKGYKVAICEQVEDPASAKGVVRREVVRVITPGTVMDEKMLVDKENNFLAALSAGDAGEFGLAASDLSTGEFHVTTLTGDADQLLDELASFQPREVLLDPRLSQHPALLKQIRLRLGSLITTTAEKEVPGINVLEQELAAQFPEYQQACTTPIATQVAGLLLHYLQQTQKRALRHMNRIRRYDAKQYMVLDESARSTLELTVTLREGKRKGSLLWLLDQTGTAMGSRLLKKWLDKPLLSKEAIEARQEAVRAFAEDLLLLEEVRDRLKEVYDLERLSARIAYGSANARDLQSLRRSIAAVPGLKDRLMESDSRTLQQIAHEMDLCEDLLSSVEQAIVDDPPVTVKEGGIIREGYDEELDRLRTIQREGRTWISQLEQREREATGIKSLKVGFNKVFGYYIEVTKTNLRHLPEGRYQRKQTLANAERFVTPELKERERMILEAEEKSVELEYRLFTELREKIAREIPRIQALAERVAQLDVLHSFAVIAKKYRYVCPVIRTDDTLLIEEGRHPVVEAAVGEGEFVANDVHLDNRKRQVLLITGPNMAGKSTYMRQVALITLMAQIGSFVPVKKAEISLVDRIFTRIGAADDLVGGRSTFMVEMDETRQALAQATPRSLILLDEVGRGTSTYDGMALAQAIVEYIHDHVGAKTLFSTHYHELTRLEEELARVVNVNARCMEKDGDVVFLHKIEPGGADRSYGIHVAQLAGMPTEVIGRARSILEGLEGRAEAAPARQLELFPLDWSSSPSTDEQGLTVPAEKSEKAGEEASAKEVPVHQEAEEAACVVRESAPSFSRADQEVLEALRDFDLMSQTPLSTMQFVHELQRRLREGGSHG